MCIIHPPPPRMHTTQDTVTLQPDGAGEGGGVIFQSEAFIVVQRSRMWDPLPLHDSIGTATISSWHCNDPLQNICNNQIFTYQEMHQSL